MPFFSSYFLPFPVFLSEILQVNKNEDDNEEEDEDKEEEEAMDFCTVVSKDGEAFPPRFMVQLARCGSGMFRLADFPNMCVLDD